MEEKEAGIPNGQGLMTRLPYLNVLLLSVDLVETGYGSDSLNVSQNLLKAAVRE